MIHTVITPTASIMHGFYFFNPLTMRQSLHAAIVDSATKDLNNDDRDPEFVETHSRTLRAWIAHYISQLRGPPRNRYKFVDTHVSYERSPPTVRPPDLKTADGRQNFLAVVWLVVFADTLYKKHRTLATSTSLAEREQALQALDIFYWHWVHQGGAAHLANESCGLMFEVDCFEAIRELAKFHSTGQNVAEDARRFATEAQAVFPLIALDVEAGADVTLDQAQPYVGTSK